MADNRFKTLEALFDKAMELGPAEREEFLARTTAEDAELGKALADLVRHGDEETSYADAIGLLASNALNTSAGGAIPAGTRIGNIEIIRRIGRGGMGDVYLGEQSEPLKRQVAVKLIRLGVEPEQMLARFEAERTVLARMNHPNIAQVYDAGSLDNGQPYFVMEYIEGEPIDTWCKTRELGLDERLALFSRICDGVQHAHQRGVIHRDLKPTNVIVNAQGQPKIIDFGIAKLAGDAGQDAKLTQVDQSVGTPQYMSPEQASFHHEDVDTRSDVYALGVLLFELLTGRSPFETEGKTPMEIRKLICETDTPRPSAVVERTLPFSGSTLQGDLDWITGKAMAIEKDRRYGSPAEIAADLDRYRTEDPVLAGPDEVSYRLRKFVRRHRTGVAASAVLLVTLVAGLAGTSLGLLRALEAERAAAESAEIANQTVTFVEDIFSAADSTKVRGEIVTAKEVVDQGVLQMRSNDTLPWRARASMLQTMGRVYSGLGLITDSSPLFEEAADLYESNTDPDETLPGDYVRARLGYIDSIRLLGDKDRAQALLDELIQRRVDAVGAMDESLVEARILRQQFFTGRGDGDEARAHFEQSRELLDANDATPVQHSRLMTGLASVYLAETNFEEAIALGREAAELTAQSLGPEHPASLIQRSNLAWYLTRSRKYVEAEAEYEKIIAIEERVFGRDHFDLGITLFNLGSLQRNIGRYRDSLANYQRARKIWGDQLGPDHNYVLAKTSNVAQIYYDLGEYDESESMYLGLIEQEKRLFNEDDPERAFALNNLGMLYHATGQLEKAEQYLGEAQDLRLRALGEGHDFVIDGYNNLGRVYMESGRFDAARDSFRKAIDIGTERFNERHPVVARGNLLMGELLIEEDKAAGAIPFLQTALGLFETEWPEGFWETGRAKSLYGEALMMTGALNDAESQLRAGLDILLNSEDRNGRHTRDAIERMIRFYRQAGNTSGQSEMESLMDEIANATSGEDAATY